MARHPFRDCDEALGHLRLAAVPQGDNLTVEIDIVLPVETPLKSARRYDEIVTFCVEMLPAVERVFLHLDSWVKSPPGHLRGPF